MTATNNNPASLSAPDVEAALCEAYPKAAADLSEVEDRAIEMRGFRKGYNAAPASTQPALTVWEGPMPESNGKSNFTAILHRKDAKGLDMFDGGFTIARSEYPDRVRYEADCVRHIIGELAERPRIWEYDDKKHSGYVAPDPEGRNWRDLAVQFDGHRMLALHHLRAVTSQPGTEAIEAAVKFLSVAPLNWEKVLAERIAALAPAPQAGSAEPIYMCRLSNQDGWKECTEDAYHCFDAPKRRIVFAAPVTQAVTENEMLRREIHNLKRHIEDYCDTKPAEAVSSDAGEREKFEQAARGNPYAIYSFGLFVHGRVDGARTYLDTKTEAAWLLWQSALTAHAGAQTEPAQAVYQTEAETLEGNAC